MPAYLDKRKQTTATTARQPIVQRLSTPSLATATNAPSMDLSPTNVLSLQRSIGNRAVADLLNRNDQTVQQGTIQPLQRQTMKSTPSNRIQRWPWSKKKDKNLKDRRRSYGADELLPVQVDDPVATLRMHIYTGEWKDNPVGHAWLELQYHRSQLPMHQGHIDQLPIMQYSKEQLKGGQHASFGFWPLHTTSKPGVMEMRSKDGKTPGEGRTTEAGFGGFRLLPGKATTQGRVEEDDQKWQHKTNAIITYKLTQPQVDSLTRYINATRDAMYSPYGLNCTTFALNAINATGHSAPAKYRISPKGVFKNLKSMAKKGDENVSLFKKDEFQSKIKDIYKV